MAITLKQGSVKLSWRNSPGPRQCPGRDGSGGFFAAGGLAVSCGLSIGGSAAGHIAIRDKVYGEYIYNINKGGGNAVEWLQQYPAFFVINFLNDFLFYT